MATTQMLEIVKELEHVGNHVSDIARVHFMLSKVGESTPVLLDDLGIVSLRVREMLCRATIAFEQQNDKLA